MRERERERIFSALGKGSVFEHTHTHTHTSQNTRRKKNLPGQKKKSLLSSSCVDPDLCPNGKGRADLSKSFFLSRARRGANGVDRSIDRGARARAKWDIGSLGSRTPPVVKRDDPPESFEENGGGGRDRSNPTPQ